MDGAGRVDVSEANDNKPLRGGLMVCGTTSDAGKSHVTSGLCRLLARRGVRVAPFKAQNMALNSFVTTEGREIGRAQAVQAWAAGVEPEVAMNPILLKPTSDRTSQVVVMGKPIGHLDAAAYHELKPALLATVLGALEDLRSRFDVVIIEGAGSPAEINLLDHDIVNLRVAHEAGLSAVIVGDIDRGGVFAALHGTVTLLPDHYRRLVGGFVINKFRGDPALLGEGTAELERRSGVPTLGVVPFVADVALDAEDSLALSGPRPRPFPGDNDGAAGDRLDIAVIRFPRLSNVTDLDACAIEPGVDVRLVDAAAGLGCPDLVVLPGTKATVADLAWLRERGLDVAIETSGALVLGICGGYQMMGRHIVDEVESELGKVEGLGWLDVETEFRSEKVTRRCEGTVMGERSHGYEIHHGVVTRGPGAHAWVHLDAGTYGLDTGPGSEPEEEGAIDAAQARFMGTSVHGLFEGDRLRATFLIEIARRADKCFIPRGVSFQGARNRQLDRLADVLGEHLDLDAIDALIARGAPQ
ncbi:MAG: cobyric acid synthase [Actinobacteria bacterium]|nr:cobyric acid synthase [Actinomycetota bacterium]